MRKIILKNAMAVAAMAIAAGSYGLMSFGVSDKTLSDTEDLRWFSVTQSGSGYIYGSNPHGGSDAPPSGCENEDETTLCAVAFPESTINPVTGVPMETNPENALPENKRYEDEP